MNEDSRKRIILDWSRLLGFEQVVADRAAIGAGRLRGKTGDKIGDKLGEKVGGKAGVKNIAATE